jgi:hypothetical protein
MGYLGNIAFRLAHFGLDSCPVSVERPGDPGGRGRQLFDWRDNLVHRCELRRKAW